MLCMLKCCCSVTGSRICLCTVIVPSSVTVIYSIKDINCLLKSSAVNIIYSRFEMHSCLIISHIICAVLTSAIRISTKSKRSKSPESTKISIWITILLIISVIAITAT